MIFCFGTSSIEEAQILFVKHKRLKKLICASIFEYNVLHKESFKSIKDFNKLNENAPKLHANKEKNPS